MPEAPRPSSGRFNVPYSSFSGLQLPTPFLRDPSRPRPRSGEPTQREPNGPKLASSSSHPLHASVVPPKNRKTLTGKWISSETRKVSLSLPNTPAQSRHGSPTRHRFPVAQPVCPLASASQSQTVEFNQFNGSSFSSIAIKETFHIRKSSVESPIADMDSPETYLVNQYLMIKELGSGSFGKVVKVKSLDNMHDYACKIVSKTRLRRKFRFKTVMAETDDLDKIDHVKREIAILKKLSTHPNITSLIEVLDDGAEDNLYMGRFRSILGSIL
jgi:hypothetical protein